MSTLAVALIFISTFMHAGWNLILGSQRDSYFSLRILLVIAAVGLGPALVVEFLGSRLPVRVWGYLTLASIFQACYYLGLNKGYQSGDFTVVYPVARALPVLLVAVADVALGNAPSSVAWLGMILVSLGCIAMPLESMRDFTVACYYNRTMIWILVTALSTIGYTVVDNAAAELLESGPWAAAHYGIFEFAVTALFFWLILKGLHQPTGDSRGWQDWKWPIVGALAVFGAYWLVLWSYQLVVQASYVVALRQFSIVVGVAIGTFLFREPARALRISASLMIALGVACIVLAG
jgi:drug/metabolite transporter (DMT)-like permease